MRQSILLFLGAELTALCGKPGNILADLPGLSSKPWCENIFVRHSAKPLADLDSKKLLKARILARAFRRVLQVSADCENAFEIVLFQGRFQRGDQDGTENYIGRGFATDVLVFDRVLCTQVREAIKEFRNDSSVGHEDRIRKSRQLLTREGLLN